MSNGLTGFAWVVLAASMSLVGYAGCAGSDEADSVATGGSAGTDAGADATQDSKNDAIESGAPVGVDCTSPSDCASGFCVSGVCCDSECSGECRACNATGRVGTCSLHAAGTDPDGDCGDPKESCSGKCDGAGACAYPGEEKLCGETSCSEGKQTGNACDGAGVCAPVETSCGLYQCWGSACLTSCASDDDCTSDAYCTQNICALKKTNGKSCSDAKECTSDVCSQSVCCNVSCDLPSDCSSGQCLCKGTACATGEKCITWYRDEDQDGFGDAAKTELGCETSGPTDGLTYSKNKDDCYDKNADAMPGQTAYFTDDRGDGSFDYDCNTVNDIQYPNVTGLTCGDCGVKIGAVCYACGGVSGFNSFGFGCNSSNLCSIGGAPAGYEASVACGFPGTLYRCDQCKTTKTGTPNTLQGCR